MREAGGCVGMARRRRYGLGVLLLVFIIGVLVGALAIYASVQYRLISVGGTVSSVELTFVYSSEKQGWIEEAESGFEKWFESTFFIDVKCNFIPMGSKESVMQIVNEELHPVAWSPASSIWVPLLNEKWKSSHGSFLVGEGDVKPLVISPVVLATWNNSFYQQHPFKGIRDLREIALTDPDGGAGDLKYGHTNPHLSNSGACIVLLEFAVAAGKDPDKLTLFDVANPQVQAWVKPLEDEAVQYGKSTGFFGDWAVEGGPKAISVFAVYENVVIEKSKEAKQVWGDSLIAVYPEEGVILSDHPFCILNAPWVTPLQRFAAEKLYEYLMRPEVQNEAQKYGFRPANPSVPLDTNIFNPENGVNATLPRVLPPPPGYVLEAVVSAWDAVRNQGVK
ncbi:MAG: extracellular solute-binding protein [Candidatus Freyarchaeota archaeon]|nr:extracellular solute-binding protein [Candidatus Freyrarchaeum guaymaensis]